MAQLARVITTGWHGGLCQPAACATKLAPCATHGCLVRCTRRRNRCIRRCTPRGVDDPGSEQSAPGAETLVLLLRPRSCCKAGCPDAHVAVQWLHCLQLPRATNPWICCRLGALQQLSKSTEYLACHVSTPPTSIECAPGQEGPALLDARMFPLRRWKMWCRAGFSN